MKPWLAEGLLISKGRKWFQRRKVITPTFHFKILEQFVEVFDRQSNTFVKILQKKAENGQTFDIFPLVTLCALDVICETAMGTTKNTQIDSDCDYIKAVKELSQIIHIRTFDVLMRYDLFFKFSKYYKRQKEMLKILHGYTDEVIASRRQELVNSMQNDKSGSIDEEFGIKRKTAFLDMLLQATIDGEPLTNLEIREEVDTFMFEGHDTTTSAISFAFYQIAQNPDVQDKIVREIKDVIGDDKKRPVTLRMYPSVPLFGRKIKEEITISKAYNWP